LSTHELKSWPKFFEQLSTGLRTHELRRNDRNYQVGDYVNLLEYDPKAKKYTGRNCIVEITSMTSIEEPCAVSDEALHHEFCIFSVRLI